MAAAPLARTVKAGDSRAVLLEDAALRIDARAANDTRSLLLEKCQSLGLARSDVPVKALLDSFLYYLVGVNIDRSHRRGAFDYMAAAFDGMMMAMCAKPDFGPYDEFI